MVESQSGAVQPGSLTALTANLTGFDRETAWDIVKHAGYPDIVAFQETWTYASEKYDFSLPGYTHFHKSAMNSGQARKGRRFGGLLTYVKSSFVSKEIPNTNVRILPVCIGAICFSNVYLPYNGHPDETLYFSCLNQLEELRPQFGARVFLGDMHPTGENSLPFQSFCTLNGLQYDKSIQWTYTEPRVQNRS